jgi:D-glycero-D-manno-heptose 1,7-bisphosphate phosphatase
MTETKKAVFLDRDGVITQDPPHYAHRLDQLALIDGSGPAIKRLNEENFIIIVITNQSGVAKGLYTEADIAIFNQGMLGLLKQFDASVDAIYYCPHHPEAKVQQYRVDCDCRKPKSGMLIEGGKKYKIDYASSFVVGDKWSDIQAGQSVGCKTILVKTGHGLEEYEREKYPVDYVAADLSDAVVNYILKNTK